MVGQRDDVEPGLGAARITSAGLCVPSEAREWVWRSMRTPHTLDSHQTGRGPPNGISTSSRPDATRRRAGSSRRAAAASPRPAAAPATASGRRPRPRNRAGRSGRPRTTSRPPTAARTGCRSGPARSAVPRPPRGRVAAVDARAPRAEPGAGLLGDHGDVDRAVELARPRRARRRRPGRSPAATAKSVTDQPGSSATAGTSGSRRPRPGGRRTRRRTLGLLAGPPQRPRDLAVHGTARPAAGVAGPHGGAAAGAPRDRGMGPPS